jgi:hypothetical protein
MLPFSPFYPENLCLSIFPQLVPFAVAWMPILKNGAG